ncbi:hypothetical protein LCGC14_2309300 [marine sediment metagenome]|uniref:Ribbon-helix-helix protein CopG domain-containing protein n=1 Tax=marine sediment metagenome TaxID=412755 RepID=A0A0F9CL46_9ZZZZ
MVRERVDAYISYRRVSLDLNEDDAKMLTYICQQSGMNQQTLLRRAIRRAYSDLVNDEYRQACEERKQENERDGSDAPPTATTD